MANSLDVSILSYYQLIVNPLLKLLSVRCQFKGLTKPSNYYVLLGSFNLELLKHRCVANVYNFIRTKSNKYIIVGAKPYVYRESDLDYHMAKHVSTGIIYSSVTVALATARLLL